MAGKKQQAVANEKQLLADIKELIGRDFVYEDGWCGMVPFGGELGEMQTGPPVQFTEMTWREQADVLCSFIHWNRYPEHAWNDEYTIRENIAADKPAEQWLDGTSLRETFLALAEGKPPPRVQSEPEISFEDLAKLFQEWREDEAARAAENRGEGERLTLGQLREEAEQDCSKEGAADQNMDHGRDR